MDAPRPASTKILFFEKIGFLSRCCYQKNKRELRDFAPWLMRQNKPKDANKLLRRARNISREPSKHAQHH
jgi:hypothetical protein